MYLIFILEVYEKHFIRNIVKNTNTSILLIWYSHLVLYIRYIKEWNDKIAWMLKNTKILIYYSLI